MPLDWTTRVNESVKWKPMIPSFSPLQDLLLIDGNCLNDGFQIENGQFNELSYLNLNESFPEQYALQDGLPPIEDLEKDIPFYRDQMADREHVNLITLADESEKDFPVILSLELPGDGEKKAYLRTKKGNQRFMIPATSTSSIREMVKYVKSVHLDVSKSKLIECNHPLLVTKLIEYETQAITKRYKFGVLYMRSGQKTDDEMYSNNETSKEYEEFLNLLGQKVELKGWIGWRGGLDVKHDSTGTHSIHTRVDDYEIMYHVSTLLPYQPDDLQRVERKRHLGNDVVVLIYKEGDGVFIPSNLKSHFNHSFLVVQKGKNGLYRVEIVNKPEVRAFSPFLPNPPEFKYGDSLRDFIQAKMINAERACMGAPEFKGKMIRTAREILTELVAEFNKPSMKLKNRKSTSTNFESALKEMGAGRRGSGVGLSYLQKKNSRKGLDSSNDEESSSEYSPTSTLHRATPDDVSLPSYDPDPPQRILSPSSQFGEITPAERSNYLKQLVSLECEDNFVPSTNANYSFFTSSGLSLDDTIQIWKLADYGKDGKLSHDEFCVAYHLAVWKLKGTPIPEELPSTLIYYADLSKNFKPLDVDMDTKIAYLDNFKKVDKDKDGVVSAQDIAPYFAKYGLNSSEVAKIWSLSDQNKDRRMHFEEFGVAQYLLKQRADGKTFPNFLTEELISLRRKLREDLPEITANYNTKRSTNTSPPSTVSQRNGSTVSFSPTGSFNSSPSGTTKVLEMAAAIEPDASPKRSNKSRAKSVSGPTNFPMLAELSEDNSPNTFNGKKTSSRPALSEITEEFNSPKNGRLVKKPTESDFSPSKNGARQMMYVFVMAEGKEEEAKAFILANMIPGETKPGEEYNCFQDRGNKKTIVLEAMFHNRTTRKKWREGITTNKVLERLQPLLSEPISMMYLKKLEKINK
eukprot:TRINITY_DN1024_c0_g1_i1.p1 TRINITY_DN1024_c0_g1~~TRINITY_DN1024_c0_g1_i1.p1  ORF type:complete len:915 (-),score=339.98 TRINITY_DN1024_c0_g1_i1:161-2905(-)